MKLFVTECIVSTTININTDRLINTNDWYRNASQSGWKEKIEGWLKGKIKPVTSKIVNSNEILLKKYENLEPLTFTAIILLEMQGMLRQGSSGSMIYFLMEY